MAKDREITGAENPIIPGDKRQLQRRPDESESAHQARLAYCQLDPDKRTIAAAYRTIKGLPLDFRHKDAWVFRRMGQGPSLEGLRSCVGCLSPGIDRAP